MEHFNDLTPAEAERLALLSEECAEVIMAISKILRHSYESHHPENCSGTNRNDLEKEIAHVQHAIYLMKQAKDIDHHKISKYQQVKSENIGRYLHHQS